MRLVITTVGTIGDVQPFVTLAPRLRRAGHTVRACSYDLYRSRFEAEGVEFRAVGPPVTWERIREVGQAAAAASPLRQFQMLRDFHLEDCERHYRDCREHTRGFDLAICHVIHTLGQAAVSDNGLRWVGAILDPSLLPTAYAPPSPMPNLGHLSNRLLWWVLNRSLARYNWPLDDLLARVGSQQRALRMFRTTSPHLNLIACSRYLYPGYPDLPPHFCVTGPWLLEEPAWTPDSDLEKFLRNHPRPVVVSFGSSTGGEASVLTGVVVEALARTGQSGILQAGAVGLAVDGADGASENVYGAGYVPHDYLFERAVCVVHHGGAGTTVAACRAGVPSVVVPHMGDQAFWAERLARLGVAPDPLPVGRLTTERLAERIRACLSTQTMVQRARDLADRIRQENGTGEAVSLVEGLGSQAERLDRASEAARHQSRDGVA
jgi:sterol 3beta-glucosyltransferase